MKNADMPAMPVKPEYINNQPQVHEGLTKREYFAAMAMQGLLSGVNGDCEIHATAESWVADIAESSVEFADALLTELERTQ